MTPHQQKQKRRLFVRGIKRRGRKDPNFDWIEQLRPSEHKTTKRHQRRVMRILTKGLSWSRVI